MKNILKAILAGLIATICILMLAVIISIFSRIVKEAVGGEVAMVLMILGVVWICGSVMFYKKEK